MERKSGVLMHVSSLFGKYSSGSFGEEAKYFVDFLADCGFSYWQVLPFCMTDEYNSPYKSYSSFSGNPYFVDLPTLYEKGLLTAEELKTRVHFPDTIAIANYSIDIHSPTGTGTELYYFKAGEYYEIPYRSLLPREYDNLLVAGRCISATHEAQSAIRIMPICANMGEAAGLAVAQAHTRKIGTHEIDVSALQKALCENGAVLAL